MTDQDEPTHFNLIDEPWIRVRRVDGTPAELSLHDVFHQADQIRALANELPIADFAILRVLLAILERSVVVSHANEHSATATRVWPQLWRAPQLPCADIDAYLEARRDRFDLLHPLAPFMQVAGMRTLKDEPTGVAKIVADVGDGDRPFLAMRRGVEAKTLSFAEAARWLVNCRAYDPSGIKSGVVGDPDVKGGKSYPIGTAWAGKLGGVFAEGDCLRETLILNLPLATPDDTRLDSLADDLPDWERPTNTTGLSARQPDGPADLFTWPSRRVLLRHDGERITGLVLTNGVRLDPPNLFGVEPMSGWRKPKQQPKGGAVVYTPATHQSSRALWRGLSAILPGSRAETVDGAAFLRPGVVTWLAKMASDEVIGLERLFRLHAVGAVYGTMQAVITDVVDDTLAVHALLLSEQGNHLVWAAQECVADTDKAVFALCALASNLALACGADLSSPAGQQLRDGLRAEARSRAYAELDQPFRSWLAGLTADTDGGQAKRDWHREASQILQRLGVDLVAGCSPTAFVGHSSEQNGWMSAGRAALIFENSLRNALPVDKPTKTSETAEGNAE